MKICKYWTNQQIQNWFNVSRTTAWRGRQRGWIRLGYHKREIVPGEITIPIEELYRDARRGAFWAIDIYLPGGNRFLLDDLIQEAMLRFLELAGHSAFQHRKWRMIVAKNAASKFIRRWMLKETKNFKEIHRNSI